MTQRGGPTIVPENAPAGGPRLRPGVVFALLCAACLALAIGYSWRASARRAALFEDAALPAITSLAELEAPPPEPPVVAEPARGGAVEPEEADNEPSEVGTLADDRGSEPRSEPAGDPDPLVISTEPQAFLIRHTGLDASYGVMSVLRLGASGEDRRGTPLRCDRLHFVGDRGVCLATDRFYTTHSIMVFDGSFEPLYTLPLNGVPSRARLSRDGRRAAVTVFVSGHSYAEEGFSTETSIIDTYTGERIIRNLEDFEVRQGATRLRAADFNFWGVTFADDSDRFYATLGTRGRIYLVEGRVSDRRVTVLREGVECPSLSPDQTRIAFKKRIPTGTDFVWRLHVLNLATSVETPLAETRHVDDQVEWLDDTTILYAMPDPSAPTARVTDIWQVPADGLGEPEPLLRHAFSPAVLQRNDSR